MELELKHLAPYLPYKLKGKLENEEYYETTIDVLLRLETAFDSDSVPICIVGQYEDEIKFFKPILRQLSDLTKEIEVNGEKFIPIDRMEMYGYYNKQCLKLNQVKSISFNMIQYLLEWHFDVFGLIEKGLAIDINSLPQSSE